ncbi:tetrathionate reductase subunit B [Salmonella enterica subsp. enterica]|nr:tetrathionate reductase subunit B [Salmonella enterica subsp. enterica]
MCCCRVCATIAITPPVCRSARYKPPFSGKMALWWWITNAASAAPIVSRRVLTTPDLSIMKRKLPINARFASIVWKPDCYPACVESCVGGARIIGDIKDPHSRIATMLHQHRDAIKVLKPENGTSPHVFYLGLDDAFVTPLMGRAQPALWQEV